MLPPWYMNTLKTVTSTNTIMMDGVGSCTNIRKHLELPRKQIYGTVNTKNNTQSAPLTRKMMPLLFSKIFSQITYFHMLMSTDDVYHINTRSD